MSTFNLPAVTPNDSNLEPISNTEETRSIFTGKGKTTDRTGEYLRLQMRWRFLEASQRRLLMRSIARLNGRQHVLSARDHSYEKPTGAIGSSISELLDVAFNATNWDTPAAQSDRGGTSALSEGLRFKSGSNTAGVILQPTGSVDGIDSPVAGVCYAATMSVGDSQFPPSESGRGDAALRLLDANAGSILVPSASSYDGDRLVIGAFCTDASSFFVRPYAKLTSSPNSWEYSQDYANLSVARCLLVDNAENALTYSEQFDNAAWTKSNCSISADAVAAPDGSTTADEFIEASDVSQAHIVLQQVSRTSAQEFWTGTVYLKENTNQRIRLHVDDGAQTDSAYAIFDANTGSITLPATASGSADLQYASMTDAGNGWYRCRVTVRLPTSSNARMLIWMCDGASNTVTYNGDGSSSVYLWGAQLSQTTTIARYSATAATADADGEEQTGSTLWVKGLLADTAQQLLAGDQIEVNGQLHILTSDVDGDEQGIGLVTVQPRVRVAPGREEPVILYRPEGRFKLENPAGWSNRPGPNTPFSDFALTLIEDI